MNSTADTVPSTSKPVLEKKKYCLQNDADSDDTFLFFDSVAGLPDGHVEAPSAETEDLLVVIEGLEAPRDSLVLREGAVYSIFRVIGDIKVNVAGIHCKKMLLRSGARHHWLASVGRADMPQAHILDAWQCGLTVGWREMNPSYRHSWIAACMAVTGPQNWRQELLADRVVLNVTGLQTLEDFYCYLGEALFGKWGYAGNRNLDAFEDVLKCNRPERILFCIPDEAGFDAFLARISGRSDYAAIFKQIVIEAGARLNTQPRQ